MDSRSPDGQTILPVLDLVTKRHLQPPVAPSLRQRRDRSLRDRAGQPVFQNPHIGTTRQTVPSLPLQPQHRSSGGFESGSPRAPHERPQERHRQAAVKGIADQLVENFEDDLWNDQVKQLIGDMVRVIITEEGFIEEEFTIDQKNVDVREFPFVKGTRYIRKGWFPRIHIFRSSSDHRELCLTDTQKGEKLPAPPEGAKRWIYWTSFGSTLRGAVITNNRLKEARREIEEQGYAQFRQERFITPA